MRTAILATWPKASAKVPDLQWFDCPRKASEAFKATIGKGAAAELWESGLGVTRRQNAGTGKINFQAGLTFRQGIERTREEERLAQTAELENRSKGKTASAPETTEADPEVAAAEETPAPVAKKKTAKAKSAKPAKGKADPDSAD